MAAGSFDPDTSQLTCAGHAWVFDLRTGEGVNPAGIKLFSYPLREVRGTIQVGIPRGAHRHYNRGHVSPTPANSGADEIFDFPADPL